MVFDSIKRLFGGMNKDTELLDIKQGDVIDALNVRTITAQGNTSGSAESILGNEFVFDLGEVVQQNKIVRVPFDVLTPRIYSFRLIDQNAKNIIPVQSFNTATFINNITGFLANVISTLNSVLATYSQTATITSTVTGAPRLGYIEFELTTILGRDYRILNLDTIEIQEAIDKSISGKNEVIGSYDLLGDLFILSTPVKNAPANISISNVTNTSPINVTTSSDHGLSTGDSIIIKAVQGTVSANGSWIVNVINSTQIILLGSTTSAAYTGGGILTKNFNGFGELGIAQKSVATGLWTYISLASTRRFNFRTMFPADMRAEVDGIRKSIYWTDNNDYYRVAYYYGAYVNNGLFSAFNSQAIYTLDSLDNETKLFIAPPSPILTVTQEAGGNLKCGNWRYAVRFVVEGNIATEWSFLTNPINVYPTPTSSSLDAQFIVGGTADEVSTKLNVIQIDNIPTGSFNFVELAAIQYVGLVPIGSIAIRQSISQQATGTTIRHTGSSVNEVELDLTTLSQVFASIVKGQNILLLDNRLIASNFYTQRDYDLSVWAQNIIPSARRKILQSIEFLDSPNGLKLEEYLKPTNTTNFVGYMINETYRLGVRVKWRNSSWSPPYFIRDLTINVSNGLPDNSLTDTTGTQIFVPFIQFTNVDINFLLSDGSVLADLIEEDNNIQFLRADMNGSNWEVLCTGILVGADIAPVIPNSNFISHPPSAFTGSTTKGFLYSPDVYFRSAFPSNTGGLVLKLLDTPTNEGGFTSGANNLEEYTGNFTGSSFQNVTVVTSQVQDLSSQNWGNNVFFLETGTITPPLANGASNVGINYVQLFRPIPNKFGTPETTKYVTTGNPHRLLRSGSITDTFDMFGGDTFTQKTFKVVKQVSPTSGYGVSFFSQNRVNSQMHLGKDSAGNVILTIPGVQGTSNSGILNFLGGTSPNLNTNAYNIGYDIQNSLQFFIGFDLATSLQNYFPVRIAWSEQKVINGISDSYRIILPFNNRDLFPSFGSITHMEEWNGNLLTWQPRKFMRQYFKSNGQLSSDVGPILIGDGSVMARDGDDLSKYGCSHKWGIVKGFTAGGKDFINWINAEYKKFMRFGLDGTVVLSDEKFMQSFFANNLQYVLNYFTPTKDFGITGVYNVRFSEAIFTIRCINPSAILAVNGPIIEGDLRFGTFLSFDGIPIVYRAKSSFTIDSSNYPGLGVNWPTYWDQLALNDKSAYNLYTIISNEYINRITSFLTFKPKIYLKYRDGYLSPHPTSGDLIYEHDRGTYLEWYKQTLVSTGTINYTTNSTSITGFGTSFITAFPVMEATVYYLIINDIEYEIASVQSNTALTLTSVIDSTGSTSVSYNRVNSEDGYVQAVVNDAPNDIKGWRAIRLNCEVTPPRAELNTETFQSYLESSNFETVQLMIQSAIQNDSTISADNPTGRNDIDTSSLWGKYLITKIFFQKRIYQKIYDFLIKFAIKSRNSNK